MRTAARPFLFVGCVELRQTLDMHALDERELIVTSLQDHLRARGGALRVEFDRAFHFQRSHLVEVELGLAATTLAEFRAGLAAADATAIYLHAVEARARGGRRAGDFAEWLRGALERRQLERVRGRLLRLVDRALEEERG